MTVPERIDREAVPCSVCGAVPTEACDFPDGPAPMVDDNGAQRRVVHAARYAETLPPEDRPAFWARAVEDYMSAELARMDEAEKVAVQDIPQESPAGEPGHGVQSAPGSTNQLTNERF